MSNAPDEGGTKEDNAPASEGELVEHVERQIAQRLEKHLPDAAVQPAELAQVLAKVFAVEIREIVVSFSGPLPPPAMLKQYEECMKGLAERIVARAEKEQAFRHEMGRESVKQMRINQWHQSTKTYLGQAGALIISVLTIGGGIWLMAAGKSAVGLGAIIAALTSLVAVFLGAKITDAIKGKPDQRPKDGSNGGK